MRRRVQAFDRAMIRCVVQVRLDRDLLAGLVSRFAPTMSAVEVLKDGAPCLGIFFLIRLNRKWIGTPCGQAQTDHCGHRSTKNLCHPRSQPPDRAPK